MAEMTFPMKISIIKAIKSEIISYPAFRYRKLRDLLNLCEDPKDIDVVLKAVTALCEVFSDIIPSYKIRELNEKKPEENKGNGKGKQDVKISKEVEALQAQEQYILKCYKDYLQILETFSKLKIAKSAKNAKDKEQASMFYGSLRLKSVECYAKLLERHPHFNYRLNILQLLVTKLANQEEAVRGVATRSIKKLLRMENNSLLEFKLQILKEI